MEKGSVLSMDRREFLGRGLIFGASLFSAFSFGCSILKETKKEAGKRRAIVYGTRYGSTLENALWIGDGMGGGVDLINIAKADFDEIHCYDSLVLGSGIWVDGIHEKMKEFLDTRAAKVDGKVIASFVVCGSRDTDEGGRKRIASYLDMINRRLKTPPKMTRALGGRLALDKLTKEDREMIIIFYRKYLNREAVDWDYMDREKAASFGNEMRR